MQKRQIIINAFMSVGQIIVISATLFVLYGFLLKTIGVEQLGIWSLVIATTSVAQIANFGLSGGVVKFVAKYVARGENENVSCVIQTAVLSACAFVGVALPIAYLIVRWLLGLVIPQEFLSLAISILPYALLSLWVMVITSMFQAGLDGYQRIDIRSLILMGDSVFYLLLSFLLAPKYGLMGLAYARVTQNFITALISWFLLKRFNSFLPILPYRWNKALFKEFIGYGTNFQIISIATMLYDPMTKALLSKFGGLSMVGYYEMASRLILQLRALIVSANQVLVPAIANMQEKAPERIKEVYLTSYQLLFYLALPLFSLIIVSLPIISELWIGHYERIFVVFGILLSVGWLLNILSAPAYFVNLGIGELRWNVIGHISIALLNLGLGLFLGILYNGQGVVIAWVVSLSLGSSMIYLFYHKRHKIPLMELIPNASRIITVVCLIGILSVFLISHKFNNVFNPVLLNSIIILSFSIVTSITLWFHPMRKRLAGWVINASSRA